MQKKIPELYAFTDETKHNMEQEFIDEVAKQVKYGKEELYAAIQLFCAAGCEHSWAFRFQQVERLDPSLVNFEIAHYYTYGSNYADMQYYINKPKNVEYYYFDFMMWFYFLKGIVFEYNNKLFMKITEEYNQKYYFGDKITIDEYYDALLKQQNDVSLKKYGKKLDEITIKYYNEFRKEDKQSEERGEFNGLVRNPFLREWVVPITQDIVVIDTPVLTDCSTTYPPYKVDRKKTLVKVYNGHKYERF